MVNEAKIILSDSSGKIELIPSFDACCSFNKENLIDNLELHQESIQLFGKSILQPRLSRFYSDPGISYVYSRREFVGIKWTKELSELNEKIHEVTSTQFNSALVNYYRNGSDSMGLHADNERELGKYPTIVSMNYGASRKMVFRRNGTKEKIELLLNHGDLMIMSGALQHNWKHEIPKQGKIMESRLNITFRKILS